MEQRDVFRERRHEGEEWYDPVDLSDEPHPSIDVEMTPRLRWMGARAAELAEVFGRLAIWFGWTAWLAVPAAVLLGYLDLWWWMPAPLLVNGWVFEKLHRWFLRRAFWFADGNIPVYNPKGNEQPQYRRLERHTERKRRMREGHRRMNQ